AYEAWQAGVHPDDRERSDQEIQAAIQGDKDFDTDFRVVHPDGTIRYIQAIATVRRDEAGNAIWMMGTNWDVTAQRLAAAELQAASAMLEEAQSVAKMGNWTFDIVSGKVTWSKQLYLLLGRDEAGGPPDLDGMLSDYDQPSAEALRAAIAKAATDGEQYSLVMRVDRPENGVRFVRGEGRARFDSSGTVIGLFGTAMDVTAEVESAELLRQARIDAVTANRSKSAFLANMSHEIRTPLTSILGFAEMLRDEGNFETEPQRRTQAIETIHNAGNHLLTVINDILDLSKIEAEKMTIEQIETPVVSILRDLESMMRPRAIGKGITLNTVFGTPVPDRVMGDPTRLRQILMNLIGNAIKFTEAGGVQIHLRVERREGSDRLMLAIEDTGPGLSPEQSDELFEAFSQANETVTRKYGGTGLGLTICRRLAALMGGTVKLVRTAPGEGSCFEVDLPLELAPGAMMVNRMEAVDRHAAQAAEQNHAIRLTGRILLAEDGPENQGLICFHLRKAGAHVEIADNGRIALQMLDQAAAAGTPFDLLLTDMQMPEMDGYTLARTLRHRKSTLAIVALTAHSMAEDRAKCEAAGCDAYTSKPIDLDVLLSTCYAWMGKTGGHLGESSACKWPT
ncbi:MAG: signal transduction histidine kinase/ActR/RegA family two-component response regulator, partial [Candidatus Azotimanducaceae bacterium]